MKFFFDYIYYRITKFYFKWDGRTGGTAIVAISIIQTLLLGDVVVFLTRLVLERNDTTPYSKTIACIFGGMLILFVIYNYRKYNGSYNKFRSFWKEETRIQKNIKGFLVIASLIVPWIPIILIGLHW
jgi:hypothetical protein